MSLAFAALAAGCTCLSDQPAQAPVETSWACDDGARFEAAFHPAARTVTVTRPGAAPVVMRQTASASGIRYTDGTDVFHAKGGTARWVAGGTSVVGCHRLAAGQG